MSLDLERELRELATHLDWPETPPLDRALPGCRPARPLVLAVALAALALAVAFAVPPARSAILRFLHLRGVTVERVETLPPAARRSLVAGLGPARTLAAAARVAGFEPVIPRGLRPYEAYARHGVVALPLGRGRLLTELSGVGLDVTKKYAAQATRIEGLTVAGDPGLWLEGGPHVLVFQNADGTYANATLRLAGNTLLWEHGDLTLRLEGPLTRDEALALAATVPG